MIEQTIRWSLFKDLALIEETDMIRKPAGKTRLAGDLNVVRLVLPSRVEAACCRFDAVADLSNSRRRGPGYFKTALPVPGASPISFPLEV